MTKEIYDSLENWAAGKACGYYEPFKDEIHILKAKDQEFRALVHERAHAARKEFMTFKLASIFAVPQVTYILFGVLIMTAVIGVLSSIYPFFGMVVIFAFLQSCHVYEEYKADKIMLTSSKAIKQNGGENQ